MAVVGLVALTLVVVQPMSVGAAHATGTAPSATAFNMENNSPAGPVPGELSVTDASTSSGPLNGTVDIVENDHVLTTIAASNAYRPGDGGISGNISVDNVPAGRHTFVAKYSGDDAHAPSEASSTFDVYLRNSTTEQDGVPDYSCPPPGSPSGCRSPVNDFDEGTPVTVSGYVSDYGTVVTAGPDASGNVDIYDNGAFLHRTSVSRSYSWTTVLAVGNHLIEVRYSGDPFYRASVSMDRRVTVRTGSSTSSSTTTTTRPTTRTTTTTTPTSSGTSGGAANSGSGYWMATMTGTLYSFGSARSFAPTPGAATTDIDRTPSGQGIALLSPDGNVRALGDAPRLGGAAGRLANHETAVALSITATGNGYWVFTDEGRAFDFGDAKSYGDLSSLRLNAPIIDSVATPDGRGYFLVAADGGVFTFGNAVFAGSTGNLHLNAPVVAIAPDPDGHGYWLVASDGGVFCFDAHFYGSRGGQPLNQPITAVVAYPSGYLLVAEDGGAFTFGNVDFHGSLGNSPPPAPIVSVAAIA